MNGHACIITGCQSVLRIVSINHIVVHVSTMFADIVFTGIASDMLITLLH